MVLKLLLPWKCLSFPDNLSQCMILSFEEIWVNGFEKYRTELLKIVMQHSFRQWLLSKKCLLNLSYLFLFNMVCFCLTVYQIIIHEKVVSGWKQNVQGLVSPSWAKLEKVSSLFPLQKLQWNQRARASCMSLVLKSSHDETIATDLCQNRTKITLIMYSNKISKFFILTKV